MSCPAPPIASRHMTVMVTGASGLLGRAIVEALVPRDEVRATVRRPEAGEALRLLGAKVAVRPVEEPDELIEILPRVHTIVHLVGGVNQPSDDEILAANYGSTIAAVAAAKEGRVRRLILLSVPGASLNHPHPFLRAKGLAEEAVVNSGLEHAVLRSSHAYGLGGLWFASTVMGAEHGFVVGDGRQRVAPVLADDVARVVAAIDDRRDPIEGVWNLSGPEALTADEVYEIAGEGGSPAHLDPSAAAERLTDLLEIPVSVRATEFFAGDFMAETTGGAALIAALDAAAPDAAAAFGVDMTPFEEGLRTIAARASKGGLIGCAAMPELVHLDVDDGVGIVRLDRPPANAISLQLSTELLAALEEAGSRDDVGALGALGGSQALRRRRGYQGDGRRQPGRDP